MDSTNSYDLFKTHMDTMIFKILLDRDHYGYEIIKLIQQNSGGELKLKEGSVYPILRRMESNGSIARYWDDETAQGARRKYYRITEKGKLLYTENKKNWEYTKRVLNRLL